MENFICLCAVTLGYKYAPANPFFSRSISLQPLQKWVGKKNRFNQNNTYLGIDREPSVAISTASAAHFAISALLPAPAVPITSIGEFDGLSDRTYSFI